MAKGIPVGRLLFQEIRNCRFRGMKGRAAIFPQRRGGAEEFKSD